MSTTLGRFGPFLSQLWPTSDQVRQHRSKLVDVWSIVADIGHSLVNIEQLLSMLSHVGHHWPHLGSHRPEFRRWAESLLFCRSAFWAALELARVARDHFPGRVSSSISLRHKLPLETSD